MSIQTIIRTHRAPFEKALEKAKKAHDKIGQAAEKAIDAARAKYEAEVKRANQTVSQSEGGLKTAYDALQEFDREVAGFPKAADHHGKKNGAAKAAPLKASSNGKAAPKKLKTKGAGKKTSSARAIKGRDEVRNFVRPPIKDAIRLILGKATIRSRDITKELKARKWAPQSNNVESYVPYVLSNGSKGPNAVFESVATGKGRGYYRVKPGAPPMKPEVIEHFGNGVDPTPKAAAPKAAAKVAKAAKAPKAAKAAGGKRKCSECGVLGHNKAGHAKYVQAQAGGAKAAKAPKAAKAKTAAGGQRKCSECGVLGHNKAGHAKYIQAQAGGAKAAKAPKTKTAKAETKVATPKAAGGKRKCSECGVLGHNKAGHAKYVQAQGSEAKVPAAKTAKASAPKAAKAAGGQRKCSECGVLGHNKAGHAKYVQAQAAAANGKSNGKTEHKPAAADKKTAAPKVKGKGEQKCSECGVLGHNKKGHAAYMKKLAGTEAAAAPKAESPKKTEPTAPEADAERVKIRTADEFMAEQQAKKDPETAPKDPVMDTAEQAFGN
jgi:hypothetical protein